MRAVTQVIAAIAADTGVTGKLLVQRDDAQLWMEIYEPVDDADEFERLLTRHADGADFGRLLQPGQTRRIECFSRLQCA